MDSLAGDGGLPESLAFFRLTEERLLSFGTHQANLSKPDDAGVAARKHMEKRLANMTRRFGASSVEVREARAALDGPAVGPVERRLWNRFLELQRWRSGGGMSNAPITLPDIEAYERRYGVQLTAFETDCMKSLDLAFLNTRAT
jgi:hypothetical protein